jgi:hypothetical protein
MSKRQTRAHERSRDTSLILGFGDPRQLRMFEEESAMAKRPTPGTAPGGDNNGDDDNDERGGRGMRIDPLIKSLLGHLPPSRSVWPPPERQKWVQLLAEILGVVYKDAEPPKPPGQSGAASTQHPSGAVPPTGQR